MVHEIRPLRAALKFAIGALALASLWAGTTASAQNAAPENDRVTAAAVERGRSIYELGQRLNGQPVQATRLGKLQTGAEVACVNCHRSSGMGQVEADVLIPPISSNFLFGKPDDKRRATMDPRVSKMFNQTHDPYTEAQLQQAIRAGENNLHKSMSTVMPRFQLDDSDIGDLQAYLSQLSKNWSTGVSATNIRIATVVTPDVDPARRQAFVDMVRAIVRLKNGSTVTVAQKHTRHHMVSAAEMVLGTERTWELEVWQLQGDPAGWQQQLEAFYRQQPVFALVSGLGGGEWQPVHDFCNQAQVPCWFPSVLVPPAKSSKYAIYFSQGLALEAEILAQHLSAGASKPKRLIQIYRDDARGRGAASALQKALADSRIELVRRALPASGAAESELRAALAAGKKGDALMLWLDAADIASIGKLPVPAAERYFSGFLGQGEKIPLNPAWLASSMLVYPYGLPEMRSHNLDYFTAWSNGRKIPLVDVAMQSEVFFAFNYFSDTLSEMLDNLYRDYLLERGETMLSQREGSKAEQETRDRVALGHEGDLTRKHGPMTIDSAARIAVPDRIEGHQPTRGTTMYPALSLGPGQRFASKGGYIVRVDAQQRVSPVSEFLLP